MFITINGHLGSGKSTVCELLRDQYGFKVFNTGSIQRQFANEMNISTLELNKKSKEDFSFDYQIDNAIVEYAKTHVGERIVFDSRLAWHFVPESFKVRLIIRPEIAAERVYLNRQSKEEQYSSAREALDMLSERQNAEAERYRMIYNININDENNYDLIVDTSDLSPEAVAQAIIENYKGFILQRIDSQKQSFLDTNCFISKDFVNCNIPHTNAVVTTVDEILQNTVASIRASKNENPNRLLLDPAFLIIEGFQTCNGKEATQRIITDILSYRINKGLTTYLVSEWDYSDIKYISRELDEIIKQNFIFLP